MNWLLVFFGEIDPGDGFCNRYENSKDLIKSEVENTFDHKI
jgi:hypothetical protein